MSGNINPASAGLKVKFKAKTRIQSDQNSDKQPFLEKHDVSIQFPDVDSQLTASCESIDPEVVVQEVLEYVTCEQPKPSKHPRHKAKKVSNFGTVLHILKANVGTGILAMPHAISHIGMTLGVTFIILLGILYTYCIHMLFKVSEGIAKRVLEEREHSMWLEKLSLPDSQQAELGEYLGQESLDAEDQKTKDTVAWMLKYGDDIEVGESSGGAASSSIKGRVDKKPLLEKEKERGKAEEMPRNPYIGRFSKDPVLIDKFMRSLDYPKLIRLSFRFGFKHSVVMRIVGSVCTYYAQFVLLLTHIGCCAVCFLFIVVSLCQMTVTSPFFTLDNSYYILAHGLPVMMCLSLIPDGYELTGVTFIAFMCQILGILLMLIHFCTGEKSKDIYYYNAPIDTWYLFFSVVFYAFEGAGTTLHLANHIEDSHAIRGKTGVLNLSFVFFILPLFTVFGTLGYWKFGNEVEESVTFNIPDQGWNLTAQFLTALGILLTYPFHFQFVHTHLKEIFSHRIRNSCGENCQQALLILEKICFLLIAYLIAAAFPNLEFILTILGADASCYLVLVVPAMMCTITVGALPGVNFPWWRKGIHLIILLLGFSGMFVGSYMAVKNYPRFIHETNSTAFINGTTNTTSIYNLEHNVTTINL